jgi:CRISPR type IV-associated protein Csf3
MAYRDRYNLENLRVRAWLRCGVISDKFLPLDGILLYQAHRDQCGAQDVTIPGDYSSNMQIATLPLDITHPGWHNWYYQCSWAQWSHEIEGRDYWNKRFDSGFADLVNFGKKMGVVIIEKGRYKAYHHPFFYRVSNFVEWYCVGDKVEIELLLSTVTHIGKKSSQGWGRVWKWEIVSIGNDWHLWRDGQLMRGVPAEDVADAGKPFNVGVYGIRPSYWKQSNQMTLVMP